MNAFDALFEPRSVGVIGASPGGSGPANNFISHLRAFGFQGAIYAIHPTADEVEGLRAYRMPSELPAPVDYLYVAVAANRVPSVLSSAAGCARIAQVISSGFGESEGGRALEGELVTATRAAGLRVVGPNSLGTHAPRGRLTFVDRALAEAGPVGVVSQSGGLATDIVRRGQVRGVRFSGVVSAGNCADVKLAELAEHLMNDKHTRVIGLYLENAQEARDLFEVLRRARGAKPVVILKGGRTEQGQAAAASHTGALASDFSLWIALCRQTGATLVDSLDDFVDMLLGFQLLIPNRQRPTRRVVLFGNGGGASVLATDDCVQQGLDVPKFTGDVLTQLLAIGLPSGSIVSNPIDVPASALRHKSAVIAQRILETSYAAGTADAVIMHVNMTIVMGYRNVDFLSDLIDAALRARESQAGETHFALVLRSDGELETDAARRKYRARALALGIPVFDEPADAAKVLAAMGRYEAWMAARAG